MYSIQVRTKSDNTIDLECINERHEAMLITLLELCTNVEKITTSDEPISITNKSIDICSMSDEDYAAYCVCPDVFIEPKSTVGACLDCGSIPCDCDVDYHDLPEFSI